MRRMSTDSNPKDSVRQLPPIAGGSLEGDDPDPEPTPAQLDPAPEPPPTPQYVSREDFDRTVRENQQNFERIMAETRQSFESALAGTRRQADPAPTGVMTDEQVQEKIDSGEWNVTKAARYMSQRDIAQFQAQHVEPMRTGGTTAIAAQAKTTMLLLQDDDGKPTYPHFKRYAKEIDEIIGKYPAGTLVTQETYEGLYHYVVGKHAKEIEKETHERAVRQATAPKPEAVGTGTRSGRTHGKPDEPDVTDQFKGQDRATLAQVVAKEKGGRNLDEQARRMGYASWNAYEEMAAKLEDN